MKMEDERTNGPLGKELWVQYISRDPGNIWSTIIKLMKATSYKENLYKMFYRWHLTPGKLAKMYEVLSNVQEM